MYNTYQAFSHMNKEKSAKLQKAEHLQSVLAENQKSLDNAELKKSSNIDLNEEFIKSISGGTIAGFCTGFVFKKVGIGSHPITF